MVKNTRSPGQSLTFIEYEDVHARITDIVEQIVARTKKQQLVIYGVPRGGLVPAVILSHALEKHKFPVRLVTSLNQIEPSDWHRLLIVDELVDSGDTMDALRKRFPEATMIALYERNTSKTHIDIRGGVIYSDDWLVFPWEKL